MKKLLTFLINNEIYGLLAVFLLTFFLRSVYTYIQWLSLGTTNWSDDFYYISLGEQIVEGDWTPMGSYETHMIVGPVIPLLVAFFIKIFKSPILPFIIYNMIITSLMVPVLFLLAKEIFNRRVALLLGIWGILFFDTFKYSPHILKEPTLYLFVPLTLLLLIRSTQDKNPVKIIFYASLSYAWLIHTDERFFAYLPIFGLFFLFIKPLRAISFIKRFIFWFAFTLMLMLPWSIRNYRVFNQVVILTPRTTAITSKIWGKGNEIISSVPFNDEEARKKLIKSRIESAIEFGTKQGVTPREYGKNEAKIKAFLHFWQPAFFRPTFIQYGYRGIKWSFRHNVVSLALYGIFLPFYIIGIFMLFKRKIYIGLLLAAIPLIHSIMHAYMVWPLERYRSPVTFVIVMIGIWAGTEIFSWLRSFFRSCNKTNISLLEHTL